MFQLHISQFNSIMYLKHVKKTEEHRGYGWLAYNFVDPSWWSDDWVDPSCFTGKRLY